MNVHNGMCTENFNQNVCLANKWTEALLDVSVDTTQILIYQIRLLGPINLHECIRSSNVEFIK